MYAYTAKMNVKINNFGYRIFKILVYKFRRA